MGILGICTHSLGFPREMNHAPMLSCFNILLESEAPGNLLFTHRILLWLLTNVWTGQCYRSSAEARYLTHVYLLNLVKVKRNVEDGGTERTL